MEGAIYFMKKIFSIILPIYGNEKNLPVTIPYIMERMHLFENYDVEIIMVNDGSPDDSWEVMKQYQMQYPDIIKIAKLSKNFGQSAAMRCGMDMAEGDVVGVISADLQDPFELFVDMLAEWDNGSKIVIATREDREDKGLGTFFSKAFHSIVKKYVNSEYPQGGFDFFLLDKSVKEEYCALDLVPTSSQLLILSLGHPKSVLKYTRKKREVGKSGYRIASKIDIAIRIVVSWSDFLIKWMIFAGIFMMIGGAFLGLVDIVLILFVGVDWVTAIDIFIICAFFTGILLTSIGIIGEYTYRVWEISCNRPRYIIEEISKKDDK